MNRLIIAGSPRETGRSAALAEMLFEQCIEQCPEDELALAPVATLGIAACMGCGACRDDEEHACVIDDDMTEIYELIDQAEELIVVSPVYFSGAPAPLKALLDRLQPFFWTDARKGDLRPATLHIVGEGHDPYGFDALISEVSSAILCAGFKLERVLNWVGKIDEDGRIESEAEEYVVGDSAAVELHELVRDDDDDDVDDVNDVNDANQGRSRAKLDLSASKPAAPATKKDSGGQRRKGSSDSQQGKGGQAKNNHAKNARSKKSQGKRHG